MKYKLEKESNIISEMSTNALLLTFFMIIIINRTLCLFTQLFFVDCFFVLFFFVRKQN